GVAWLPRSLIAQDLDAGLLAVTGNSNLGVAAKIRLYRLKKNTNKLTREIWTFLSSREKVPLITNV
ncbi:MAG: LysR family transcriptional regulator, partial [Hyphomicrobiales bacterium]